MSLTYRALLLLSLVGPALAQDRKDFPLNTSHIVYHDVKTDASGAIVPWYNDRPSVAYDHDLRLVWKFWLGMRTCGDHIPYYLQHQVWKEKQDDERGIGGDQIPMALDSWNLLYGYLGDPDLHTNMAMMADYWLNHGMSAPAIRFENLPYPYDLDVCSGTFNGDMRAGNGYLQPDKAASFGKELVVLYKITGNRRYLAAAVKIADTLVATVKPGDAEHSPWPFRVHALTGRVAEDTRDGRLFTASYTSNWTPALRLFYDLQELHEGNGDAYKQTAALVETWLKTYALPANKWGPFFEDIPTADYSDTEINADTLAAYILEHPAWGGDRKEQAAKILKWTEDRLGNHNFSAIHVTPINEQTKYLVPGNSHTSRHASVKLLYCEKTGDCRDQEEEIRRLNWATYSVNADGRNRYPNDDIWLTDGYGDYVRHYLRAMASLPELAPEDQNHLLRTSSVIQRIEYSPAAIAYRKFDARSEELLKITAGFPASVVGGKFSWNSKTKVMTIHSSVKEVRIDLKPAGNSTRPVSGMHAKAR
jgi:hypothetical protein